MNPSMVPPPPMPHPSWDGWGGPENRMARPTVQGRMGVENRTAVDITNNVVFDMLRRPFYQTPHNLYKRPTTASEEEVAFLAPFCADRALFGHLAHTAVNRSRVYFSVIGWFPDGRRLIGGTASGELVVWNGTHFGFEDVKRVPTSSGALSVFKWARGEETLFTGDVGGNVQLASPTLAPVSVLRDLAGHPIMDLAASPTDMKLAGAGTDAHPLVWDLRTQRQEVALSAKGYDTSCLDWHPYKGLIVTGTKSNQMHLWDPRVPRVVASEFAHKNALSKVKFNPSTETLLTAGRDTLIQVWDLRTLRPLRRGRMMGAAPQPGTSAIDCTSVEWHPTHPNILCTGDTSGSLSIWDCEEVNVSQVSQTDMTPLLRVEAAHESSVNCVSWSPLGHILASSSADTNIRFWTTFPTGKTAPPLYSNIAVEEEGMWKFVHTKLGVIKSGNNDNNSSGMKYSQLLETGPFAWGKKQQNGIVPPDVPLDVPPSQRTDMFLE